MKILVTGGVGYIGSILVPQLLRNHQVIVLDSLLYGSGGLLNFYDDPHLRFVRGDIRIPSLILKILGTEKVDAIVHLAALRMNHCSENPRWAQAVNVEATKCLLEMAIGQNVRHFILASSCSIYGAIPVGELVTEETRPIPLSSYAETKIAAEELVRKAEHDTDICTTILRFASAYGLSANMRFDLLLNGLALDAATKDQLDVWGAETRRALVHVRDLSTALIQCLESDWRGIINVGGHNRCKRELVSHLKILNRTLKVNYSDSSPDMRDYGVDFSKIRALGFSPRFTPEAGLHKVMEVVQIGIVPTPKETQT